VTCYCGPTYPELCRKLDPLYAWVLLVNQQRCRLCTVSVPFLTSCHVVTVILLLLLCCVWLPSTLQPPAAAGYTSAVSAAAGHSAWVSSPASRGVVFDMRAGSDAVVVGGNTVRRDNPRLTTRRDSGHLPVRVVMSRTLDLPEKANLWDTQVGGVPHGIGMHK
jgi:hypothetical protein